MGVTATYDGVAVTDIKVEATIGEINQGIVGSTFEVKFVIGGISADRTAATSDDAFIKVLLTTIEDDVKPVVPPIEVVTPVVEEVLPTTGLSSIGGIVSLVLVMGLAVLKRKK